MNWLAHLHLSGESPSTRIGNLLPDIVRMPVLRNIDDRFLEGIDLHRAIDSFTDRHEIFRASRGLIEGATLRRYSPIFIDMFYDHFLAKDWSAFSDRSLEDFVGEFHDSIEVYRELLPEPALTRLRGIRDGKLLLSYQDTSGIEQALQRIGRRTRRKVDLERGIESLHNHYEELLMQFHDFYPQLQDYVVEGREPRK